MAKSHNYHNPMKSHHSIPNKDGKVIFVNNTSSSFRRSWIVNWYEMKYWRLNWIVNRVETKWAPLKIELNPNTLSESKLSRESKRAESFHLCIQLLRYGMMYGNMALTRSGRTQYPGAELTHNILFRPFHLRHKGHSLSQLCFFLIVITDHGCRINTLPPLCRNDLSC